MANDLLRRKSASWLMDKTQEFCSVLEGPSAEGDAVISLGYTTLTFDKLKKFSEALGTSLIDVETELDYSGCYYDGDTPSTDLRLRIKGGKWPNE